MGGKINALRREIRELEIKLGVLVEERAHQTGYSIVEIMLTLDALGYISSPPGLRPEEFDASGELQRMVYKIRDLAKELRDEEERE
jgi:hypothetical protein